MNMNRTVTTTGKVGGDYFGLMKKTSVKTKLSDYIALFKVDEYHIYKMSGNQYEVSYEDFLKYKHSGYIFFKKELYNKLHINNWIKYLISIGGIKYITKPLPPFNPEKIIIKK